MLGAHGRARLVGVLFFAMMLSPAEGAMPHHVAGAQWARDKAQVLRDSGVGQDMMAGDGPALLAGAIRLLLESITEIERDTAFVEVFSGMGHTASMVSGGRSRAFTFDRTDGAEHEDICCAVLEGRTAVAPPQRFRTLGFGCCIALWDPQSRASDRDKTPDSTTD